MIFPLVILISAISLFADDPLFRSRGVSPRATALGGAYTAVASDYSAFWYNPAGLAFVPVNELSLSFWGNSQKKESTFGDSIFEDDASGFALGAFSYLRSLPVRQGGISYSFSLSSPEYFGDIYSFSGWDRYTGAVDTSIYGWPDSPKFLYPGDLVHFDTVDFFAYGSLYYLSSSVGFQFAEGMGLGASLSLVTGSEEQKMYRRFAKEGDNSLFENTRHIWERSYIGYDARLGLLMAPSQNYSIGFTVVLPQIIKMDQTYRFSLRNFGRWEPDDVWYDEATITRPMRILGGGALFFPRFLISFQGEAAAPLSSVPKGEPASYWKLKASGGLEVRIIESLALRGGYSYSEADLHNYKIKWDPSAEVRDSYGNIGEIQTVSWGFGYFASPQIRIDFTASHQFGHEYETRSAYWQNVTKESQSQFSGEFGISFMF